MFTDISVV